MKVLFFASLREAAGVSELVVNPGAGSLEALLNLLAQRLPNDVIEQLRDPAIRIAVDQQLVDNLDTLPQLLTADAELAFLPPVTGG